MEFHVFAEKVNARFNEMTKKDMFIVDIDSTEFAEAYLKAFPKGSNPIYIERTEHDCTTCKQFISRIGMVVTINEDGSLNTIWDVENITHPYDVVAKKLAKLVRKAEIKSIFMYNEPFVGKQHSVQLLADGATKTWDHFWADIPEHLYTRDLAIIKSKANARASVHERSLKELSTDTLTTVLDLITSDSIYRGAEHLEKVKEFLKLKTAYNKAKNKETYAWLTYKQPGAGIRSSVIGTLLVDIEEGKDLEGAVKSFEAKVAPANYKRPKAVVTKRMMEEAIKVIDEEGLRPSLQRRQALPSDISVKDVLFVDRSVGMKDQDPLMDFLEPQVTEIKGLDKAQEISIADFLSNAVPNAKNISLVATRTITGNKVQLSAPAVSDAPVILQWDNNFSWSYTGNVADSDIAKNVKESGGAVDGYLRCSLQWNEERQDNTNDLDLHCKTPTSEIFYGRSNIGEGRLDVDVTRPESQRPNGPAVENITWPTAHSVPDGAYTFFIHNFNGYNKKGFRAEIAIGNEIYNYDYPTRMVRDVQIATVTVKDGVFTIKHHLPHITQNVGALMPVKLMMLSPNYWDGAGAKGNKHYFFITDEEQETTPFRGYYGEFISPKFHSIRKSLDLLASNMQCEPVAGGLAGYGFSSTRRASVFIKADYTLYKVLF